MAVKDTSVSADEKGTGKLLSPQDREACQQLLESEAPHSQRAQALLALDEGATQVEAGELAGLSGGQVKYWLAKFRKEGMGIFPESALAAPEPKPEPDTPAANAVLASEVSSEEGKKPKAKGKVKKGKKPKKKAKKGKGAKKSKKGKKGKKGKSAAGKSKKKSKKKK